MDETAQKPRKGYVRAEVLLPALRYQIRQHPEDASVGVLAIMTPDGTVTLTLHRDAIAQLGTAMILEAQKMAGNAN